MNELFEHLGNAVNDFLKYEKLYDYFTKQKSGCLSNDSIHLHQDMVNIGGLKVINAFIEHLDTQMTNQFEIVFDILKEIRSKMNRS